MSALRLSDIAARSTAVEKLEVDLDAMSTAAEQVVQRLNGVCNTSRMVMGAVGDAEQGIAELQEALHDQRRRRNDLKRDAHRKHALQVAQETDAVSELEGIIVKLREESTKLDYEILAADADILTAKQRVALVRVGLSTDIDGTVEDAVTESEHAMLDNDALFRAVTTLPTQDRVSDFMSAMQLGMSVLSTNRTIRTLVGCREGADVH